MSGRLIVRELYTGRTRHVVVFSHPRIQIVWNSASDVDSHGIGRGKTNLPMGGFLFGRDIVAGMQLTADARFERLSLDRYRRDMCRQPTG